MSHSRTNATARRGTGPDNRLRRQSERLNKVAARCTPQFAGSCNREGPGCSGVSSTECEPEEARSSGASVLWLLAATGVWLPWDGLGCALRMATGFELSSDSVRWRGRVWLLATAVGVVLAVGAAHASGASAYVYWANGGGGLGGTIGRANLDGTGANQSFITGASKPTGVAVDGTHVYWADNATARSGGRTSTARAQPELHHRREQARAGWRSTASTSTGPTSTARTIGRANLDGTGANQSFITGAEQPVGVAVDGQHVYWANTPRHDRAGEPRRHGRQPELHHRRRRDPGGWRSTASTSTGPTEYSRTRSGGPTSTARASTRASSPARTPHRGWRSTAQHVYWANSGGDGTTIGRANLDGTGANQSFITGVIDPWGVAVDALLPPAPVISSARLSSPAFRAAARGASLTALSKTGTDIRYRDSQAATTTFSVLRGTAGHKTGRLCVAGAPRKNQKPCTRFVSAGSFTHKDQAGNIKVHFTGRVRGKKLSPGSYRLALTPQATPKAWTHRHPGLQHHPIAVAGRVRRVSTRGAG